MVRLLTLALVLVSSFTSANALGINCRGGSGCKYVQKNIHAANVLTNYLNNVDDHTWYNNREYIACATAPVNDEPVPPLALCAYFQNSGGGDGARVKKLAGSIPGHGCNTCGNVPYWYPEGNNNVNDGQLTYDAVSDPGSSCPGYPGLC
ncbi:hypothetical protein PoHVEF18_004081 [Penicillium ochrochloron]